MTSVELPQLPELTASNADVATIGRILQDQQARKQDIVVPASSLRFQDNGLLVVEGLEHVELGEDGVFNPSGLYRPTGPALGQLANVLDIPVKYLRKLYAEAVKEYRPHDPTTPVDSDEAFLAALDAEFGSKVPYLLDTNLNALASRLEDKKVLLRLLWGSDPRHPGTSGVLRAVLSDKFRLYDNLDTLLSVLSGMRDAGLGAENIRSIDLSDNRLYMTVHAPEVQTQARELLKGYKSVYTGQTGDELPIVFAGMVFSNSEVGSGAFQISPQVVVQVCTNGLTMTKDVFRKVHLGGKLDEGTINWSGETVRAANEFVKAQVKDYVTTFLSKDYLDAKVAELEASAGVPLGEPTKAEDTIKRVAKELVYSKSETEGILNHFILSGQFTSGGVAGAVTSYSQQIEDVDRRHEFNDTALRAMELAARWA